METNLKINIHDYLSDAEIKRIVEDELRERIREMFKNESESQRLLSNLSYYIVYDEIDKIIPNSRDLVQEKTMVILKDIKSYQVFRDRSYGSKASLAYEIMENSVRDNKDLINEKVKETIINSDYNKEIWDKFEELGENFIDNIYSIVELGRKK